jgi:hypothetical protein
MWEGMPGNCQSGFRIRHTRMNQERVVPDTPTSSRSAQARPIVDVEFGAKHSLIEVELTNVRKNPHEPGNFYVDVLRFLNGFPTKNEFILLHATNNGTLLHDSVPIIPNKRYRIMSLSENIKNGDILQARLLIRFNARVAHELR